jgi:hypothetical protein
MCAPLAQTRDMGRIAAPDENCLEASPGIEPGCKDLQADSIASTNLLILTRKPISSTKRTGIKRFSVASKGRLWYPMTAKRRFATLTKCERGDPRGSKDFTSWRLKYPTHG